MKDGIYAIRFEADGYKGNGEFQLQDNRGEGHDQQFRIEGHLIERATTLSAVFNVLMLPSVVRDSQRPAHYSLDMSGTSSDDAFSLIGTGPLGIIVGIHAEWRTPLSQENA